MSTVTPPADKRAELQRKVSDPLERLRGYIRIYIAVEGAAVVVVYLALWFWIGLALDYGFFRLLGVDWVQVLPWGLRAGVLSVLIAGLLALLVLKVTLRLLREFRAAALALVLERRFPKLLGDRLITAVELADPQQAAKYGYSQTMIDQTIQEAAERVEQVPVNEAFNWGRLARYGLVVTALTAGMFLLTGVGYCVWEQQAAVGDYFDDFDNVTTTWFERNILLQNVIWPRKAYLEVVAPERPVHTIGKNVAATPIRVRALKWVIADPRSAEGWRALRWQDLTPRLLRTASVPSLPVEFFAEPNPTVDAVEARLTLPEVRQKINRDALRDLETVLEENLTDLAAQPSMRRKLRKLEIPDDVRVSYRGESVRSEMTLQKEGTNEYTGTLTDLREPVGYQACAADYCTPVRRIDVVPPPALAELLREEAQPAYLYHRAAVGTTPQERKGLKQHFPAEKVYLGGETSRIDLPAGTDLVLTGKADKDLARVALVPRGLPDFLKAVRTNPQVFLGADARRKFLARYPGQAKAMERAAQAPPPDPKAKTSPVQEFLKQLTPAETQYLWSVCMNVDGPTLADERRTFRLGIARVSQRLDFELELVDTENVVGRRHVIVQPSEDMGPEVEVQLAVIRKTPEGYKVTPSAMVPFEGWVRDDHGLDRVQYEFAYQAIEGSAVTRERALLACRAMGMTPQLGPGALCGVGPYLGFLNKIVGIDERETSPAPVDLPTFAEELRRFSRADVGRDVLRQRLREKPRGQPPFVKQHTLRPDDEYFDIARHLPHLKVTGVGKIQPRYRLRLWLTAADSNVETGPREARSREQFNLVIVSENELLAEIAKEEEGLHLKLDQAVEKLKVQRTHFQDVQRLLGASDFDPAKDFPALATRVLAIAESVNSNQITAKEVLTDYNRILKEMRTNRVDPRMIAKVEKIVQPLDEAVHVDFGRAEDAQREYFRTLEKARRDETSAKAAADQLDLLIDKLSLVLERMGELSNINQLITALERLEADQQAQVDLLNRIRKRIEDAIFGDEPETKK